MPMQTEVKDPTRDAYPIPEIDRVGAAPVNTTQGLPESISAIDKPTDQIMPEPEELQQMKAGYDSIKASLEQNILKISEAPTEIDTKGLIGQIMGRFSENRNRIMESALGSVKKASVDLDAYFGSPTSDQRSGARARMAMDVKNSMMQSAYKAIGDVYDKNTEMIVTAELEGAKLNLQSAAMKAQAIAEFTNQATHAYLGVMSETNKNYTARLGAAVDWAQIQAQARGQDIQFASQMRELEVAQRGQDLQASVAQRGQELDYSATTRGQDIQKEISFAQIKSNAEQLQLERDKANLQAAVAVWSGQDRLTQERWAPVLGGTAQSKYDLGGYVTTTSAMGWSYTGFKYR